MADGKYSWDATYYLKGIAIASVLINHYLNYFVGEHLIGFARGIIAIFFVLSGYGIHKSLSRRFGSREYDAKSIARFYLDRFLRIVPLLIVSLFIIDSSYSYFGVPEYTQSAFSLEYVCDSYWFIIYLMHCYLLAVVFFPLMQRYGARKIIIIGALFLILLNSYGLIWEWGSGFPFHSSIIDGIMDGYAYRGLSFSYLFLFLGGMFVAVETGPGKRVKTRFLNYAFVLLFFLSAFIIRFSFSPAVDIGNSLVFCALAVMMVMLVLLDEIKLVFRKLFIPLGKYSLSLYLLNMTFYTFLRYSGMPEGGWTPAFGAYTLVMFPLFFFFCVVSDNLLSKWVPFRKERGGLKDRFLSLFRIY